MTATPKRKCDHCGKLFAPKISVQRFHAAKCRSQWHNARMMDRIRKARVVEETERRERS